MTLANQTLARFLDLMAEATPAPGGGSAAALACALGAALVEMAAGIESGREGADGGMSAARNRAGAIRGRALELADGELSSYARVLAARRLPAGDPERGARLAAALEQASASPLEIAEAAIEAAELGRSVAAAADPAVRGDALVGVQIAAAAAGAAAGLVQVNLAGDPGNELLARAVAAREAAQRAAAASSFS